MDQPTLTSPYSSFLWVFSRGLSLVLISFLTYFVSQIQDKFRSNSSIRVPFFSPLYNIKKTVYPFNVFWMSNHQLKLPWLLQTPLPHILDVSANNPDVAFDSGLASSSPIQPNVLNSFFMQYLQDSLFFLCSWLKFGSTFSSLHTSVQFFLLSPLAWP